MSSRREFLTASLAATGAAALAPRWAAAQPKSMTVVHESSFIKPFDEYFVKTLSPEYEKLTKIKVNYETVSVGSMPQAEVLRSIRLLGEQVLPGLG